MRLRLLRSLTTFGVALALVLARIASPQAQIRARATSKPIIGVGLNYGHPLTVGLIGAWHFSTAQAAPYNLARPDISGAWVGTSAHLLFTQDDGGAFISDNVDGGGDSGGDFLNVVDNNLFNWTSGPWSVLFTVNMTGALGSPRVVCARGNFGTGGWEIQAAGNFATATGQLVTEFNTPSEVDGPKTNSNLTTGLHDYIVTMNGSGTGAWYVDGVANTGSSSYTNPVADSGANALHIGVNWPIDGADVVLRQPMSRFMVWNRSLSAYEAQLLSSGEGAQGNTRYAYMRPPLMFRAPLATGGHGLSLLGVGKGL